MTRRRTRLVGLLWRWHRRLGVVAAFFVLLLAATGIVLNHSSDLGLDRRFVDWPWLSRAYGDSSSDLPAFELGAHWLSRAANGHIYHDDREVGSCSGTLVGAVHAGDLLYAACAEELLVITTGGELVESITASTGLPVPIVGIGMIGDEVVLQTAERWWLANLDTMEFGSPAKGGRLISQLAPDHLPAAILARIPAAEQWLSWERFLLDLHSGRLVGRVGVLWVDAVGVLLASLATSGIAMWWLHRRRRQH